MYDVAIIGAGLGGLETAYILTKLGKKVIVLEKNPVLGGCLQTFKRHGHIFDTGFHYIGGLDDGQPLNRIFKYFNLMDLPWQKLESDGFDEVIFGGKSYMFKNGYDEFQAQMTDYFPSQKQNIKTYTDLLRNVGDNIFDAFSRDQQMMMTDENSPFNLKAYEYLTNTITDPVAQNVLSGVSPKLTLVKETTPLYTFAQINASFIKSAYRIKGGGQQIADRLADSIRKMGGEIVTKANVTRLVEVDGAISRIEIDGMEPVDAKQVVSNIHPKETMRLIDSCKCIRKVTKSSILKRTDGFGMFTVNIALKPGTVKYLNRNIYIHENQDVWMEGYQKASDRPTCALVSYMVPQDGDYATGIDILTPMMYEDVAMFDNGTLPMRRGQEYEDFKTKKAEQLIDMAEQYVPGLKSAVSAYWTSTPLTYKSYTSTFNGSAYGINEVPGRVMAPFISGSAGDFKDGRGLFQVGQNVGLHGILGVSMNALVSAQAICPEFKAKDVL